MKNFRLNIILRLLVLAFLIFLFLYTIQNTNLTATVIIIGLFIIIQIISIIKFVETTNKELTRFLLSIKHSDFSQTFSEHGLGKSFKELNEAFNSVMDRFRKTRSDKEEHLRYLQTVMQHVGVGLISYHQDGNVEFINNAAKKLLKVNYLKNISELDKISKGLQHKIMSVLPGTKAALNITDENEIVQLVLYTTVFRMRNQTYTLVAMQSIQSELEDKEMEAWQKLIRVLTHEIMNSVTPISSLAGTVNNMLNDSKPLSEESVYDVKNAVATIQKRSEGLIHFVENYRNLTKIPKPNFEIFKISQLFDRLNKLLYDDFANSAIELSFSVEPETLELTADPELIEQVMINILINAKQALQNIQDPQVIVISHIDERGRIVIRIIDNGPGINPEVQEKIFIPFYTTKKEGSGIGLSLSRQIMRSHGGNIRVNSKPDSGSTFILKF